MKRIIIIILTIGMLIVFSGCTNRIVVNQTLSGQSEHWSITYDIKGRIYTRYDRDGNERFTVFGKYNEEVKFIGDMSDLQNTTIISEEWNVNGVRQLTSRTTRYEPYSKPPTYRSWGQPSVKTLLAAYNDEFLAVTFTWNGDNGGEETINFH